MRCVVEAHAMATPYLQPRATRLRYRTVVDAMAATRRGVPTPDERRALVDVAMGRVPADLSILGASVLDPFRRDTWRADVLVHGRHVAAVLPQGGSARARDGSPRPPAHRTVHLAGGVLTPGLIDGHVHLESSLVSPSRYAEVVLPRGVTGVVCDPHEIANVAGDHGMRWLMHRASGLPFDVFVTVPSCVPSSPFESSGAVLDAEAVRAAMPRAVGLAEVMDVAAVLAGADEVMAKIDGTEGVGGVVEGHAPGVTGVDLMALLAAGIDADHETTGLLEAREKVRAGMFLWVREGTVARDAATLAPLVDEVAGERIGFCSDDVFPHDLLRHGGVDRAVATAIAYGASSSSAFAAATWNVARRYGLARYGAVAPGYVADVVWWQGTLDEMVPGRVFKAGREVAVDGRMLLPLGAPDSGDDGHVALQGRVRFPGDVRDRLDRAVRWSVSDDLGSAGRREGDVAVGDVPAIGVVAGRIVTERRSVAPRIVAGRLAADPDRDLALLVCAERHGRNGNVAAGLVQGFGIERGALASTVGHDHHNAMVVGADAAAVLAALGRLEAIGGGFVAIEAGTVVAELPLPLAGLMTDASLPTVCDALDRLDAAAQALGCTLPSPFMALSFLGLPVIPSLKLTDVGLIDVDEGVVVGVPWGTREGT